MRSPQIFAASLVASAAREISPASATSRAAPAVSAATTGLTRSARMMLRHWPSAWMWLSTVLMVFNVAPFGAIN